jgi:hypothetical protein
MAHVTIDPRGVGPIRLDRDDVEPMPFDQAASDRRAGSIELRRAMSRLPEEDDLGVREAVEIRAKLLHIIRGWQGLARGANEGGRFVGTLGTTDLGNGHFDHELALT